MVAFMFLTVAGTESLNLGLTVEVIIWLFFLVGTLSIIIFQYLDQKHFNFVIKDMYTDVWFFSLMLFLSQEFPNYKIEKSKRYIGFFAYNGSGKDTAVQMILQLLVKPIAIYAYIIGIIGW